MTSCFNEDLLNVDVINWRPAMFNINNEVFVDQRKLADSKFIFAVFAEREKFMVTLQGQACQLMSTKLALFSQPSPTQHPQHGKQQRSQPCWAEEEILAKYLKRWR